MVPPTAQVGSCPGAGAGNQACLSGGGASGALGFESGLRVLKPWSPETVETVSVVLLLSARPQTRPCARNSAPSTSHSRRHHQGAPALGHPSAPVLPHLHAGLSALAFSCLFSLPAVATPRDAEIRKDVQVPAAGPVVAVEHRLSGDIRPLEARPGLPGFLGWGQGHFRAWSFTGSKGRPGLSGLEWGWWGAGGLTPMDTSSSFPTSHPTFGPWVRPTMGRC